VSSSPPSSPQHGKQLIFYPQCCNPGLNGGGGWGIFNALFGWTNSATYGSVLSYNFYWIAVIVGFLALRFRETHGRWPLLKAKAPKDVAVQGLSDKDIHRSGDASGSSLDTPHKDGVQVREVAA
jgi:high-affinity Fe2+/Pb2+ permease